MTTLNVLLVGASGYGNVGDDAYVDVFEDSWPQHALRVVNSDHAHEADRHVRWADVVVIGGGGLIYCNRTNHFERMTDFLTAAEVLGKPWAFWSVGVQLRPVKPLETTADVLSQAEQIKPWAKFFPAAKLISVRNPLDAQLIEAVVPAQTELPLLVAPDVCHTMPKLSRASTELVIMRPEVIIPTGLMVRSCGGLEAFVEQLGLAAGPRVVAQFSRDDEATARTLAERLGVEVVKPTPGEAMELLATARRVVTGRYHGAVLARAAGVSDVTVIDPRYKSAFEPNWTDPRDLARKHIRALDAMFDDLVEDKRKAAVARGRMPLRVLFYGDFLAHTGFARVGHELLRRLNMHPELTFSALAMNYYGEPYGSPQNPWVDLRDIPAFPAALKYPGDWRGHRRLLELISASQPDVLFSLQDVFNLAPLHESLMTLKQELGFRHVLYFPVDAPLKRNWAEVINGADVAVTYTDYGRAEVGDIGARVSEVIYHGVDTKVFYPDPAAGAQARQGMGVDPDEFLIVNVNRNTPRKDLARTIDVWLAFKENWPELKPRLYLHTVYDDPQGINLMGYMERYVPEEWRHDIIFPQHTNHSDATLRGVYNAADAVLSTSLGEGWGFSMTEAMACGTPVVMPHHTSHIEILGGGPGVDNLRGWFTGVDGPVVLREDNDVRRWMTDVTSAMWALRHVAKQTDAVQRRCDAARAWVGAHCDWDKLAERWAEVLLDQRKS